MRRMIFAFVAVLFLLGGCAAERSADRETLVKAEAAQESERETFSALSEQENFKCYGEYGGQSIYLEGQQAKALYDLLAKSNMTQAFVPEELPSESVRLVFYASEQDFPWNEDYESCLDYTIYSDGLIAKGQPHKLSAPFYFRARAALYEDLLAKLQSGL